MSPATIGVYAAPERKLPFQFTVTALKNWYRRLYWNWCGPCPERDQKTFSGLPDVLLNPDTCSLTYVNVYEPLHENATGRRLMGDSRTLSCPVCDLRSDRTSDTRAN